MTINRETIEKHLVELNQASGRRAPDEFLQSAINLFCTKFEAEGWPSDMPNFTVLSPGHTPDAPLGQDGYAGYVVNGVGRLWRWPYGGTDWATEAPPTG